jgi:hypothetical protein
VARPVKYFSLHRIDAIELRVVSDVDDRPLPVIQIEEDVICDYSQQPGWPHTWVMLFILQDLQPLVNQLHQGNSSASLGKAGYDPSQASIAALNSRPMVNIYDMADLRGCNVYVNRQALLAEGYWDDPAALKALFAHEHAHPLAENETTNASRRLRMVIERDAAAQNAPASRLSQVVGVVTGLAEKLCLFSPREIFTNQATIERGFGDALLHLNRRNVSNAAGSVAGRQQLLVGLQQEVEQGKLAQSEANLLLLLGDLNAHLPLAVETAPFYRAGRPAAARELEAILETEVFSQLDPLTGRAFKALQDAYIALQPDSDPSSLLAWSSRVVSILTEPLSMKGLDLRVRLQIEPEPA